MSELISKQALKNALTNWQMEYAEKSKDVERFETLGAVIELVELLPTIEPKCGKWINDGKAYALYKCSAERMYKAFKYCPNCGAKMEMKEE